MKITQHGIMWIKGSPGTLTCPECNINQIKFKVIPLPDKINPTKLVGKCLCTNCACEFQHERDLPNVTDS